MNKKRGLITLGLVAAGLAVSVWFTPRAPTPARAQNATPDPYLAALQAQATQSAQATTIAQGQQQSAESGNGSVAAAQASVLQAQAAAQAAQAQLAAAQAQAIQQAQQATQTALDQQRQLDAAKSTVDAAQAQATAIVQMTRTALEVRATSVAIEATRQAVALQAQQAAARATLERQQANVAATQTSRDNNAVATAVANDLEATRIALARQSQSETQTADMQQALNVFVMALGAILAGLAFVVAVIGLVKIGRRWLNRGTRQVSPGSLVVDMAVDGSFVVEERTDADAYRHLEKGFEAWQHWPA